MNQHALALVAVAVTTLIVAGCGVKITGLEDCRITDIGVTARYDAQRNQESTYRFQFFQTGDSPCGETRVSATYNLGTGVAQERLERPGVTGTSSWRCTRDPWIQLDPECERLSMHFAGTAPPSDREIKEFEFATGPLSAVVLVPIDRDTLKGQLGNALRDLPPPAANPAPAPKPAPAPNPNAGRFPLGIMGVGASGPRVEALQLLLRNEGFAIAVDGDFGPQTAEVVRQLQRSHNQTVTGTVSPATWVALLVPDMAKGAQGDAVMAVQTLLIAHGQEIEVDGDFGDQTEGALRAFQASLAIEADGKVGFLTWAALLHGI